MNWCVETRYMAVCAERSVPNMPLGTLTDLLKPLSSPYRRAVLKASQAYGVTIKCPLKRDHPSPSTDAPCFGPALCIEARRKPKTIARQGFDYVTPSAICINDIEKPPKRVRTSDR